MGALFTASVTGDWNASATWGKSGDPAVEGTDYPGNTDWFTINAGVRVNVNGVYPASGTLGTTTDHIINGILEFNTNANTGLNSGNVSFVGTGTIQTGSGGTVGAVGASYLCVVDIATTVDSSKTFGATGLTTKMYGSASYYGSQINAVVNEDLTAGTALKVNGDLTSKWVANQWLAIHKGTNYSSYTTDMQLVQISSMGSYSGVYTTINLGTAVTTKAGATVLNMSRNVIVRKNGVNLTSNNFNTNRPSINLGNYKNSIIDNVEFQGVYSVAGIIYSANACVVRNSNYSFSSGGFATISNTISCMIAQSTSPYASVYDNCWLCSNTGIESGSWPSRNRFKNNTEIFANSTFYPFDAYFSDSYLYGNGNFRGSPILRDCTIDASPGGATCNTTNFLDSNSWGESKFYNVNYRVLPTQNVYNCGRILMDWVDAATGSETNKIYSAFGTSTRVTAGGSYPAARGGGSSEIYQIGLQALACVNTAFEAWRTKIWLAADTYTIDIYLYTDYAADLNNGTTDIKAFCWYPDTASSGSTSLETDTSLITKATWDNLQLGFTSNADGWVEIWVEAYLYSSGKYIYIDPMIVVTAI